MHHEVAIDPEQRLVVRRWIGDLTLERLMGALQDLRDHPDFDAGFDVISDLSEARVADHVLLLSGRVVASGPPDDILTAEHLTAAYGPALLHVEAGRIFIDDPAHAPVPGRHTHRERTIHTEPSPTDRHAEE